MLIHGHYHEPEFLAWKNMLKRVSDPRFAPWYGDVKVCDEWVRDYEAFLQCMGRRPTPQHSLDRIDPAGDYTPGNVRWATKAVQSRNTKLHRTNTTGIRGVSWSKAKNRWRAAIYVNNRQRHVGYFDTIEQAAAARRAAEQELWT